MLSAIRCGRTSGRSAPAAIGTPRVIRKLWKGPMKLCAKNATQMVPTVSLADGLVEIDPPDGLLEMD